ncbi:MAG: hypothetical protein O3A44_02385 [Actinomycetota bacterium]|nr:hypothetical protein [Actinomycetota bacterium]
MVLVAVGFGITSTASAGHNSSTTNDRVVRTASIDHRRSHFRNVLRNQRNLRTVAAALGMTSEEVKTELRAGKSLADIATSKGIEVQTVIDAIVANMTAKLAEKVTDGTLTQTQADAMATKITDRVTAMVNGERPHRLGPAMRGGKHAKHGGHGRHMHSGAGTATGFPRTDA